MLSNIRFSEEAKLDVHKAKCFFEFLGKRDAFFADLMNQLELINKMPYAFQVKYSQIRIVTLQNFNFSIHYRAKADDNITIYRILNQKQDF